MRYESLFFKLTALLALTLTACPPQTQAAVTEQAEAIPFNKLSNGLTYSILKGDGPYTVVELKLFHPQQAGNENLILLTHAASFHAVHKNLQELNLSLDPSPLLHLNEFGHSIRLAWLSGNPEETDLAMHLIKQAAFQATIEEESIEAARQNLLSLLENGENESPIAALTYQEVQAFYAKWYQPQLMHLSILTSEPSASLEKTIVELFSTEPVEFESDFQIKMALEMHNEALPAFQSNPDYLQNIQYNSNFSVIDGKIWMDNPNWINKSSNGHALGAFLTAIGLGGIALAITMAPAILPAVVLAGSLSTGTGIYLLNCNYLKDPSYIYEKRQEDLQKGFYHAYRNNRAGITLTPYERRPLFIQEMINGLPQSSIEQLTDLYDLSNPLFAEILSLDEMAFLVQSKLHFIQFRNHYQKLIEKLDKELLQLTAPYAKIRDNNLANAKNIYNQNVFVFQKNQWKAQLEENIALIEAAFKKGEITLQEKKDLIEEHEKAFEKSLNEVVMAAGLSAADAALNQMQNDILLTYDLHVSQCKQSIQYDHRKAEYKTGKKALIYECDAALRGGLATYPLLLDLPDYVDLRTPFN